MKKTAKRGKGGTSFVSVVKAALDKGITDGEEIIKVAKKELPGIDEKKLRARVNATIKYLGKKPAKKVKAEKPPKAEKPAKVAKKEEKKEVPVAPVKEEKKVEAPKVETPKIDTSKGPSDTPESVKGPEAAQAKLGEALEEKKEEGLGDIVIQ
jgi:hypothetical protein